MRTKSEIEIYTPDREIRIGFFSLFKEIFADIARSRELIWRLFLRDFSARYRQSILGVLWALIMPLIIMGVFVYLHKGGILRFENIDIPYPVFALFGLTVWTLFSTGLAATSESLVKAGAMIVKINFPKISLVIAAMGEAVVDFLIRLCLLAAAFIIFKVAPHPQALFLPLVLLPLIILTLGLGLFLSLASGVVRDIPNIIIVGTTFLMFICPVAYPLPDISVFAVLNRWNPLACLIVASRDIVFTGTLSNPGGFIGSSIFAFFVFFMGLRIFHIAQTKITERV